jgi:hypothetical protein
MGFAFFFNRIPTTLPVFLLLIRALRILSGVMGAGTLKNGGKNYAGQVGFKSQVAGLR